MKDNTKIQKTGISFFIVLWAVLFAGCFLSQDIYAVVARYASLGASAGLAALFFTHVNPAECFCKKNTEFFLMVAADVLTLVNLFVIGSNKGALLTVVNLLLVIYLADKVRFTDRQTQILAGCAAFFLLPWFAFVKWEYNFNMAGLVFLVITILGILFLELLREKCGLFYLKWIQLLLYLTGMLYTILYHSRCAMMGMIAFGVFLFGGKFLQKRKSFRRIIIIAATAGSILFTVFYVWLGTLPVEITFLYKSILSGREEIWAELWQALFKQPFTGIGSSYRMKSFFIFEVHNGLFDILAVHGIVIFFLVLVLLIRKMWMLTENMKGTAVERIAFAGMISMLFTSFFENFFIVPPYLLVFFLLLTKSGAARTAGGS